MADPLSDLKSWLRTSKDEVQNLAQAARSFASALTSGGGGSATGSSSGKSGGLGLAGFTSAPGSSASSAATPGTSGSTLLSIGKASSGPANNILSGLATFSTPPAGAGGAGGGRGGTYSAGTKVAFGAAAAGSALSGAAYMTGETNAAVNMQQALFQGAFSAGNASGANLDRFSTMSANSLGKFQTSVGSAQRSISSLSEMGFSPDSAAGKMMLRNIGGISATTGMSNEGVASTLASSMTNPTQTNLLRLMGVETYGKDGDVKAPGQIALEMLQKMGIDPKKVSAQQIQLALRPGGQLDLMIKAYFPADAGMQNIMRDQFRKIAMNGGNAPTNSADEIGKMGLGDAKVNPRISQMNYASAEGNKADLTRNAQVEGYTSGYDTGAGLTEGFTDLGKALGPVVQGFSKLGAFFETFLGKTTPGGFLGSLLPGGKGGDGKGGDAPPSFGGSGGPMGGEVSFWPTMNASTDTSAPTDFGVSRAATSTMPAHTHKGIDIGGSTGTPLYAWREGEVVTAVNNGGWNGGAGNYVELKHASGYYSRYLHMVNNGVMVKQGQKVTSGQQIGKMGSTGNSTAPHLHFEIRTGSPQGTALNPWPLLNTNGTQMPPGTGAASAADPAAAAAAAAGDPAAAAAAEAAGKQGAAAPFVTPWFKGVNLGSAISGVHATAQTLLSAIGFMGAPAPAAPAATAGTLGTTDAAASAAAGTNAVTATGVKGIVQEMAASKGWTGAQWDALDWIVQHESSWSPTAQNPTSTAYGLFQFLNSTWAGTGVSKTSDPALQAQAGLAYISNRYGDPLSAKEFWEKNHWYDSGGWLEPGTTLTTNHTGKPEAILTGEQWDTLRSAANRQGVDADDLAKRIGEAVSGGNSSGAPITPKARGERPQVSVTVQLMNASEVEAQRLARRVKQILEEDTMYDLIGVGQ